MYVIRALKFLLGFLSHSNLRQKQLQQGQHLKKRCKLWAPTWQKEMGLDKLSPERIQELQQLLGMLQKLKE